MNVEDARIEIVEEPASNLVRLLEGSLGPLLGVNSTADRRTYPAIKIVNYTGEASVLVSIVTGDEPYRTHPHNLVGQNCARGVCYIGNFTTNSESPSVICFRNMRIQYVRMHQIEARLTDRQILRIDPFGNGFHHMQDLRRPLNRIRLCFQVIIKPDPMNAALKIQLTPQVTQPINISEGLIIREMSDTSSPKCGGKRIMIFCNRVSKGNIRVRFFQKSGENEIWEDWGTGLNIHQNFGISFTTPRYVHQYDQDINLLVHVFAELVRVSDNVRSAPICFQYIPDEEEIDVMMKRKNSKIDGSKKLFQMLV